MNNQRGKAVSKREELVQSALELFAKNGYAATSVKAIANHAEVSQGLLYNHFENKQALLVELMAKGLADVQATLELAPDLTGTERLESFLTKVIKLTQSRRAFWTLFYALRFQVAATDALGETVRLAAVTIREQLEDLCRQLEVAAPDLEARLLFAEVDGICQHAALEPDYPIDAVMTRLLARYRAAS